MSVFIDIPGVGPVEAKNAASESTLRELVRALKGGGSGGGGAAGGGGAGGAPGGLGGLGKAAGSAAKGLGTSAGAGLSKAAKFAAQGVTGVGTAAIMAGQALMSAAEASAQMIDKFANVGNSLESAASTLSSIPVIGGTLSAVLGAVAGAATGAADAFTAASGSGATFGGSVNAMAKSASQAGMTLDQFANLIAKNGEGLLAFGSSTEGGAKRFAALSKDLRDAGSDLYALGYSTEQINDGLAKYGALMRAQGMQGRQSNAQLVAGAKSYLKELDSLAKITGEERSAKEAEMKKLATDAQFSAAMAGKDASVRASFQKTVLSLPGPLQGFVKDFLATGTLTTEETQRIGAMMGGEVMQELQNMRSKMNAGVALTAAEQDRLAMIMKKSAEQSLKNSGTALAASRDMDAATNAMTSALQLNEGAHQQAAKDQTNAAKNTDKMNEQVRKSQEALAAFSNSFQMALANSGLLNLLMDAFSFLANIVQKFVIPAFNILTPILAKVFYGIEALLMPVINALSGTMGGLEGTVSFIDDVLDASFAILDAAIRGAITIFGGLFNGVSRLLEPFKVIFDRVTKASGGISTFTDIIAEAASVVGGALEFLGEILATVVEGFIFLYDATVGFLTQFEFVNNALSTGGAMLKSAFETLKLYLSADGAKLLIAQMKDLLKNTIGEFFTNLLEWFEMLFIDIRQALPNMLGGISKDAAEEKRKEIEERKKAREEQAKLDAKQIENLKGAAQTTQAVKQMETEAAKDANAQARKEFNQRELNAKKLGGINDKETDIRKEALKGKEEATKNLNDPIQLLMAEAKQQKSGLIKTPEAKAAAAAAGAKAGVEAKAMEKVAEEQKAKEEAAKPAGGGGTGGGGGGTAPAGGQTSGQTAIAQLNTNIEELVRLMRINNNLTSEQASGLSRLAGSVTGDLFQV
jgi:hypothetical protein